MKKNSKGDQQKEKLLIAARQLFAKNGYEASSTKKISQQIGAADGLLYYYFPKGKRQLLNEVIKRGTNDKTALLAAGLESIGQNQAPIAVALSDIFHVIWQVLTQEENYETLIITVRERAVIDQEQIEWLLRLADMIKERISAFFSQQIAEKRLKENNPAVMSELIISIYESFIYRYLILSNQTDLTEAMDQSMSRQLDLLLSAWI